MLRAGNQVLKVESLGFPFRTLDPFLFAVYHDDKYPSGNGSMGPDTKELLGAERSPLHTEQYSCAPQARIIFASW